MRKLSFILLLLASPIYGQQQMTAYDALRVVGTQVNRGFVGRVISVSGVDGDPQPLTWRILVADKTAAGGVREVEVANGRVVAQRTPTNSVAGSTDGATISTARLNLDSSGAFSVASHTADQGHTNFALVSYTLRNDERGYPVWIVTLQDEARRPIGTIHIGANKGTITRVEGMYRGANMAQVEQDRAHPPPNAHRRARMDEEVAASDTDSSAVGEGEEDDRDVNPVKKEFKRMFQRTKHDAERIFGRARRSFEDFFYRN